MIDTPTVIPDDLGFIYTFDEQPPRKVYPQNLADNELDQIETQLEDELDLDNQTSHARKPYKRALERIRAEKRHRRRIWDHKIEPGPRARPNQTKEAP